MLITQFMCGRWSTAVGVVIINFQPGNGKDTLLIFRRPDRKCKIKISNIIHGYNQLILYFTHRATAMKFIRLISEFPLAITTDICEKHNDFGNFAHVKRN